MKLYTNIDPKKIDRFFEIADKKKTISFFTTYEKITQQVSPFADELKLTFSDVLKELEKDELYQPKDVRGLFINCKFNGFSLYSKFMDIVRQNEDPTAGFDSSDETVYMGAELITRPVKFEADMATELGRTAAWNIIFVHEIGHAVAQKKYNHNQQKGYLQSNIKPQAVAIIDKLFNSNQKTRDAFSAPRVLNENYAELFMANFVTHAYGDKAKKILEKVSAVRKKHNDEDYYTFKIIDEYLESKEFKQGGFKNFEEFSQFISLKGSKIAFERWLHTLCNEDNLELRSFQKKPSEILVDFLPLSSVEEKKQLLKKVFTDLGLKKEQYPDHLWDTVEQALRKNDKQQVLIKMLELRKGNTKVADIFENLSTAKRKF